MLTAGELALRIATKLQIPPTDTYVTKVIPRFLNDAYNFIWDSSLWDELVADDFDYTIPANTSIFILPKQYDVILRAYNSETGDPIKLVDRSSFADRAYSVGTVYTKDFILDSITALTPSPVQTQLVTAQRVTLKSSSTDTVKIFIRGLDADGERVSEIVTLNGATPVSSSLTYSAIEAWSKTARPTLGFISLMDASSNVLATLGAWETTSAYPRYQIDGENSQDFAITLTCKKAFIPFENEFDYPFTELDEPLIHRATMLGWIEHRKMDMAQAEDALFQKSLATLKTREANEDNVVLFVPAQRG